MATLSGQTIQSTYQGLLKLATSSSGLTSTLQTVEDGLGGSSTMRVSTGRTQIDTHCAYLGIKPRFIGTGVGNTSGAAQAAGTQNILIATPFEDSGIYSYSAITYRVGVATTTSDSVECAFYSNQSGALGNYPFERVGSVQTLTGMTSVLEQTIPISGGNISFSATGAGIYWFVYKYNNSGTTPTVRFTNPNFVLANDSVKAAYTGIVLGLDGIYTTTYRKNGNRAVFSGQSTFDTSFTYSGISNAQSTTATIAGGAIGFHLHTNNF